MNGPVSLRAFTTPEEAAALTRENPKGRLLEFCARARCGAPEIEIERGTTLSGARITVTLEGRAFDSGMQWASDRMTAEQRAARALLDALALTEEEAEPGEWVSEDEEARLRRENPKGALLERCARRHLTPRFDVRPVVTTEGAGFEAGAFIERAEGDEVWGDLRRAQRAKTAEQGAAASLLARLEAEASAPAPVTTVAAEPRSVLNELRQRGAVRDFGFAVERVEGPPHAPVFHMKGFVARATGERLEVTDVAAPSKKEGERLVAGRLLERL